LIAPTVTGLVGKAEAAGQVTLDPRQKLRAQETRGKPLRLGTFGLLMTFLGLSSGPQ